MRTLPLSVFLGAGALGLAVLPWVLAQQPVEPPPVEPPPAAEDTATTGDLCAGFSQPGCVQSGCPEGQVCRRGPECVPSLCDCDPRTGETICSLDCGGGTCVDAAEAARCQPLVCKLLCPFGFATDEQGCEICQCERPPRCACVDDEDCVKVVPGCCPCELDGAEQAIASACVDQLVQCPVPPEQVPCMAYDRCTDRVARCVGGECVLQNQL